MSDVEPGRTGSARAARWRLAVMAGVHRVGALLKVLLVTVGSILAVLFASLIISIIQFQARLTEARSQNVNVTLESLQLLMDHQDYVTSQFKAVRSNAEKVATLRPDYQAKFTSTFQMVSSLCATLNPAKQADCNSLLLELISSRNAQIDDALAPFRPAAPDAQKAEEIRYSIALLQRALADGAFVKVSAEYLEAHRSVETGCQTLMQYVSDRLGATTVLLVSPELRATIRVQCSTGGVGDSSQPPTDVTLTQTVAPPTQPAAQLARPDAAPVPDQGRTEVRGVSRNLLSELVFYYRFYVSLTKAVGTEAFTFQGIILAPPEFILILLVIATGTLGSFLFHTYTMFLAPHYSTYPSWGAIFLRGTLSVMCALIIFILSRTGFVVLTDGQRAGEAAMSPFVIAFVSVAAGLLAERALERIRSVGERALEDRNTEVTKVETKSVEITTNAETKPATG
jgi:hypothetical protein